MLDISRKEIHDHIIRLQAALKDAELDGDEKEVDALRAEIDHYNIELDTLPSS